MEAILPQWKLMLKINEVKKMIFVMLSPLFIIGFIALSIYEEKRRKKNEAAKKASNDTQTDENQVEHQDKSM